MTGGEPLWAAAVARTSEGKPLSEIGSWSRPAAPTGVRNGLSPLEGGGFEPSVPGTKEPIFAAEGHLRDRTGAAKKGCFLCGTDGSNHLPPALS